MDGLGCLADAIFHCLPFHRPFLVSVVSGLLYIYPLDLLFLTSSLSYLTTYLFLFRKLFPFGNAYSTRLCMCIVYALLLLYRLVAGLFPRESMRVRGIWFNIGYQISSVLPRPFVSQR